MADVAVADRAPEAQWVLHCAPADAPAVGASFGIDLGTAMLRATRTGDWHALHLAPDEWLLIGGGAAGLGPIDVPHALVDVSDRSLGFEISGADAASALNAACPLDLDDAAFPLGSCTRTLFGKVTVVLWRTGDATWRLDCGRSFAPYVRALLGLAVEDADD